MIDEEIIVSEEIISDLADSGFIKRYEPIGNGFLKLPAVEFCAFNAAATVIMQDNDPSMTSYTYSVPDTNPEYVWARIECDYYQKMTPEEQALVVDRETAISQGMVVETGEI